MTTQIDANGQPADDIRQLETPSDTTEPSIETRQREPDVADTPEPKKPEIQFGSKADRKRQEINERFQRQVDERGAKVERADETERMMGGSNLQTRADREAAEAAAKMQDASQVTAEDIPPPRRVRLKVNGEDREYDEDQVQSYAQIALASEDILNTAKRERQAAQDERQQVINELAELRRMRADHSRTPTEQPNPAPVKAEDTKPATDEELDSLIEAIQTGEMEDAKRALAKHGDQIVQQAERRMMERIGDIDQRIVATTRQMQEDARVQAESQAIIRDFSQENDDFAQSATRQRVLADEVENVMRANLRSLNIPDDMITQVSRQFNIDEKAAIGQINRKILSLGYSLPDNASVLREAADRVRKEFGMPGPRKQAPAPAAQASTSSILAERDARKQAMAPQPRRATVTPGPDLGPAKSKEELAREHIRAVKVSRRRY